MCERRQKTGSCRPIPAGHKGSGGIQHRVTKGRKIRVIAYSGYKGEESPRSFFLDEVKVDVVSLMEMWTEESMQDRGRKRFFKVRGGDGFTYTLYLDEVQAEWFLGKGK